jgi:hypothetical protein
MTDDLPPEFADVPVIDMGEITPEDMDAAIEALNCAIKTKTCKALRAGFDARHSTSDKLPDTIKRGILGLLAYYADHGENGGRVARLMRKSGFDRIPVKSDHSINWEGTTQ